MDAPIIFRSNTIGDIVAFGLPEEIYLRDYAAQFCEWVDGTVIQMSPVHMRHDTLTRYFATLLDAYFEQNDIGQLRQAPFVMRLEYGDNHIVNREPDLQVILHDNPNNLTPTLMQGAADIAIEVVSHESTERDYQVKFREYEQAGVREYWLIDPLKSKALFYHLNEDGDYALQVIQDDIYKTSLLPNFQLHIPTFWEDDLPRAAAIVKAIEAMFNDVK